MSTHSHRYFEQFEALFGKEEISEFVERDGDFFAEYALESWLKRYFDMKIVSRKTHIPSITSVVRDTPSGSSNTFNSKTENSAMKSILAEEWLEYLYKKIDLLPIDFQDIINMKYLSREGDGKLPSDIYVFSKLGFSKTSYYEKKKMALEELGRYLYPN